LKNNSNNIWEGGNIERISDIRNTNTVLDPDFLVDFANCKYKAAQRIAFPSYPNSPSEIEAIQKYQQGLLKERWRPTTNDGYEAFNGTLSSSADFRTLSIHVFGNVRLIYNRLQCDVDGIEKSFWADGQRPTYSPLLISLSAQPSVLARKTLALASIITGKLAGVVPKRGVLIVGPSQQRITVNLSPEILVLEKVIREVKRMIDADKEAFFRLNNHCSECAFSRSCRKKAVEIDHLSLLSGISDKELKKLNGKGIFSVTQLSYTFRPRRSRKTVPTVKNNYALRALAIREKKTYIVERPKLSTPSTLVFLDIEGLPDRNFFYLIGLLVIKGGERKVFQFWADSENDQEKIWRQFIDVIEKLEDFVIFHHGNYDSIFVKKMQDQYGNLNGNPVNEKLINTLSLLYGKVYFPTYSNGLKEIVAFLGFNWSDANASGIQSIAWRLQWEEHYSVEFKDRILKYNREDCEALALLVAHLKGFEEETKSESVILCENLKRKNLYGWGRNTFAFPELEFINNCAYFDYQHEKIFWRTSDEVKKSQKKITMRPRKVRVNKVIVSSRPCKCPVCASIEVVKHGKRSRIIYDIKFSVSGVKRWVVNYRNHRFICQTCRKTFYPSDHPETRERFGNGLVAWIVYQNIGLRQSQENVGKGLTDIFGLHFNWRSAIPVLKKRAAITYHDTYEEILSGIQGGHLVHVDETNVSVKGTTAYVWVFTNLEEVAYVYSATREGAILEETLRGFHGVLVSDFFPVYESIECEQQRCLVHLIRDLNDDLFKNLFDLEYKTFVQKFGELLKPIIVTIDRFGLKRRFLSHHKKGVEKFFKDCVDCEGISELTRKYQTRFAKNRNRLFTFLDHDGVPWNNNNAENAIKGFATMRRVIGGTSTEAGLRGSLMLLSVCQTLRNKGCSSLDFFRSGKTSLKQYLER
jgi:predicted RecB family nuclease